MKLLKNKLTVTIIVLSVAFLGLITFTVSRENKGLESGAGSTLNPVQKVAYGFNRGVKDFVDFFLNFSDVRDENKELKKENDKLKAEIDEYSKLKEENERLQKVLNFKDEKNNYDYIGTNIIGISGDSILNGYIVDRGKDDGIEKGMVVISADGLVGQVSSVGNNWAIVQCIVNENVKVAVMVDSTRENTGILQGYKDYFNNNLAKVLNLPMDSEVKEGDIIVTSGLGGYYPKEIKIGEVVSVEEDRVKVMKSAIVKPYVDFNKIEELFIVAPKDKREIKYD
ncbi:MAG: rod shape-determining protein MreC [Clostridium sp.]|uniref:Cell shape-determining protein MreC n=1 Tax=Clostridium paraputrificum TaxID=29363 RepID=A0A6N3DP13_9CLOT|nr:rod shape-determining protein MreC [Clostridium sp.]MBS5928106.1 rod shape-determining protein MreC [Clostridium sp.]MBS5986135.1 rod shape-determining protein MreC [Clostridium sp.]